MNYFKSNGIKPKYVYQLDPNSVNYLHQFVSANEFTANELETFFKTANYFKSIKINLKYIHRFGLTHCELINRLIDSKDDEKITNLRITIDFFIKNNTQYQTSSKESTEKQIEIFGIALVLNELGMDPAAAYKMTPEQDDKLFYQSPAEAEQPSLTTNTTEDLSVYKAADVIPTSVQTLDFLEECGFNRIEFNVDTIHQDRVCRRFLGVLKDYLNDNRAAAHRTDKKPLIDFILTQNLFTHPIINEGPWQNNVELPLDLKLELNNFSQNCLSGILYEQLLNLKRENKPEQYLQTTALVALGKVLNTLEHELSNSPEIQQQFFDALHNLSPHENSLLSDSLIDQVITTYNLIFKNKVPVTTDPILVKLLLTNPSLSNIILALSDQDTKFLNNLLLKKEAIISLHYFSRLYALLPDLLPQDINENLVKKLEQVLANTISALVKNPKQINFDELLINEFEKENLALLGQQLRLDLLFIVELATIEPDFEKTNAMITLLTSNDIKGKQFFNAMNTTLLCFDDIETRLQNESSRHDASNQSNIIGSFKAVRKESENKLFMSIYTLLNAETLPTQTSIRTTMTPILKPIFDTTPQESHPWVRASLMVLVNSLFFILTLGIANLGNKLISGSFVFFHQTDPKKQLDTVIHDLTEAISNKPFR